VPTVVNVDGDLVQPSGARISVFDRGFLHGDSVYEVIRTYRLAPFEIGAHLGRLTRSAERIGLDLKWDPHRTRAEIARTVEASRGPDSVRPDPEAAPWNRGERYIRIVMTRGSGEIGLDPALAVDPVAVVIVQPLSGPPAAAYRDGVACMVADYPRAAPEAADPTAKTGAHLSNVLAIREARARGAHEALLLDRDGFVTEGASSNVFAVRAGRLETPPLAAGLLEGVTRGIVLALSRQAGLAVRETSLLPRELQEAEEVFITSTVREILPVTRLGGRPVGAGRVGPVTTKLHALFRARADRVAP